MTTGQPQMERAITHCRRIAGRETLMVQAEVCWPRHERLAGDADVLRQAIRPQSAHAVVHQAVEAAALLGYSRAKGLVNAVLRRVSLNSCMSPSRPCPGSTCARSRYLSS